MHRKNPIEQTVELTIDDETYQLFFSFDAIAAAEDVTNLSLLAGMKEKDIERPRISMIRALLWACLQPRHPEVTRADVALMVNQWNWAEIWGKVLEAWIAGMKKPDANAPADPQKDQG